MENNKGERVTLRKIPIAVLLDALQQIYASGIDYIDIIGDNGIEQDTISLRYRSDYMMPIENDDEGEQEIINEDEDNTLKEHTKDINLSDDDLDKLTDI